MATVLTLYSSNLSHALWKCNYRKSSKFGERTFGRYLFHEQNNTSFLMQDIKSLNSYIRYATTKGSTTSSQSDEEIPSWAKPGSDEPPPWAREEGGKSVSEQTFEIPFYVYLLASAITAIASIGSVFEYVNQKPVFGILASDSIFYAPLLGFFAITGVPTSAFLWFKSVQVANKAAEEQDRRDGFR